MVRTEPGKEWRLRHDHGASVQTEPRSEYADLSVFRRVPPFSVGLSRAVGSPGGAGKREVNRDYTKFWAKCAMLYVSADHSATHRTLLSPRTVNSLSFCLPFTSAFTVSTVEALFL